MSIKCINQGQVGACVIWPRDLIFHKKIKGPNVALWNWWFLVMKTTGCTPHACYPFVQSQRFNLFNNGETNWDKKPIKCAHVVTNREPLKTLLIAKCWSWVCTGIIYMERIQGGSNLRRISWMSDFMMMDIYHISWNQPLLTDRVDAKYFGKQLHSVYYIY